MIHDVDLIDVLVSRIEAAAKWAPEGVASVVVRVWGGDVHADAVKPNELLVQLWPQQQTHTKTSRGGTWDLSLTVSIGFYFRCSSQQISEVDERLQAFDRLLVSEEPGLGSDLLDVVDVSKADATETFIRGPEISWPIRPDPRLLQRMAPKDSVEGYTGLVASQANMTYTRH